MTIDTHEDRVELVGGPSDGAEVKDTGGQRLLTADRVGSPVIHIYHRRPTPPKPEGAPSCFEWRTYADYVGWERI